MNIEFWTELYPTATAKLKDVEFGANARDFEEFLINHNLQYKGKFARSFLCLMKRLDIYFESQFENEAVFYGATALEISILGRMTTRAIKNKDSLCGTIGDLDLAQDAMMSATFCSENEYHLRNQDMFEINNELFAVCDADEFEEARNQALSAISNSRSKQILKSFNPLIDRGRASDFLSSPEDPDAHTALININENRLFFMLVKAWLPKDEFNSFADKYCYQTAIMS